MTDKQFLHKEFSEAQYVGDEGNMVVDGRFTLIGAYRKMIHLVREDCGDMEAKEFMENNPLDQLGTRFARITTDEEKEKYDDSPWIVMQEKTDFTVWFLEIN
jgi:hypothetical protein